MLEPCDWHEQNTGRKGHWANRRVMPDGRVLWIDIGGPDLQFCYSGGMYLGSRKNIQDARALCESGKREKNVMGLPNEPLTTTPEQYKEAGIKKPRLKWTEIDKNNWHADPVEGESQFARIRRLDDHTFCVYRDSGYWGSEPTLEHAKMRAELKAISEKNRCMRLWEHAHPTEMPPFLVLTEGERAEWRRRNPISAKIKDKAEGKAGGAPAEDPTSRRIREATAGRPAKQPKPAELDAEASLSVVNNRNPKKAGSAAHGRWEKLLGGTYATVAAYLKDGGNPETLKNAVAKGYVKLGE